MHGRLKHHHGVLGWSAVLASLMCMAQVASGQTSMCGSLVMGGFDSSRGGIYSLHGRSEMTTIKSAIGQAFPGVEYKFSNRLTDPFLNEIDVLLIASATGGFSTIDPLSRNEQAALRRFVDRGGSSLVFVDNDTFAGPNTDLANESLIDPFGLDVTGTRGQATIAITNPSGHLVTNGPFGLVSSMHYSWFGGFNSLGPHARSLSTFGSSSFHTLSVIDPGTLTSISGGVVLFSDASMVANPGLTPENTKLVLNAIAFCRPRKLLISGSPRPGSTLSLDLYVRADAGLVYQVGSSLGKSPVQIGSRLLCLSFDPLLWLSTTRVAPHVFARYSGVLDPNGRARAAINLPNFAGLIGARIHTAFVTLSPPAPFGVKSISRTFSFSITK